MNKDSVFAFALGCFLFMVPFIGFMVTVEKLNSIQSNIDIHNDITTGNATYLPGKVCMIRAGEDDSPADIVNFSRACASAHDSYLKQAELESTSQIETLNNTMEN